MNSLHTNIHINPTIKSADNIHCYIGNTGNLYPELFKQKNILSATELERFNSFKHNPSAKTYLCAHVSLRLVLSQHLQSMPQKIKIAFPHGGKPQIMNFQIDFNISHSKNNFIIGLTNTPDIHIGVDIEERKSIDAIDDIMLSYFHYDEREYINNASDITEKHFRFLEIWTRKEALLKMTGHGLVNNLNDINVAETSTEIILPHTSTTSFCSDAYLFTFRDSDLLYSIATSKATAIYIQRL